MPETITYRRPRRRETKSQRHMRLMKRNIRRFIIRYINHIIIIMLLLIGMVVGIFIGIKVSDYNRSRNINDYGRKIAYISYEVKSGDTVWSIASDLAPLNPEYNDVRQYVKAIEEANGIHGGSIRSGNHIIIPCYVDSPDTKAVYEKYGIK